MQTDEQIRTEIANSQKALRLMLDAGRAMKLESPDEAEAFETLARAMAVIAGRIEALLWVVAEANTPLDP